MIPTYIAISVIYYVGIVPIVINKVSGKKSDGFEEKINKYFFVK